MRLTKRQLKRIIREEYSRLKRRGLINENAGQESELREMIVNHYRVQMSEEYSQQAADAWISEIEHCTEQEMEGQDGIALEMCIENMRDAFGLGNSCDAICDLASQIIRSGSASPYGMESDMMESRKRRTRRTRRY